MYITTIQGALYKAAAPFGIYGTRSDALNELQKQLKIIDDLIDDDIDGNYLCGSEVSLADASLFPTMVFIDAMFPKFGIENGVPSKLAKWFKGVREKDADFAKIYDEVRLYAVATRQYMTIISEKYYIFTIYALTLHH